MPAIGRPSAQAGAHEHRRPETTVLYEVVRDNLESLCGALAEGALPVRLPRHARKELEAYLGCGLLCRGFVLGGYLAAGAVACGATAAWQAATPGPVHQASSGMAAFGDLVVFLTVFAPRWPRSSGCAAGHASGGRCRSWPWAGPSPAWCRWRPWSSPRGPE